MSSDPIRTQPVRRATLATLILLLIQFALGTVANLYVTIPAHHPGAHPSNYFSGSLRSLGWALHHSALSLAAHSGLGLLLVLAAIGLLVQTRRLQRPRLFAAAALGALCVIGAGFNGLSFLDDGKNVNSLIMALLFALAMLCYLSIMYATPAGTSAAAGR